MSRSNPSENAVHPCQRWHEWDGEKGAVRYYDKEKKENVEVGDKFTFILLDQLGVIKGWNDASDSGIISNEIRDTKAERFVVKAFKGGVLAEGFYASIKDRIKAVGGHFTANLYIAFKRDDGLVLGSIQFKGAALNAWVEFLKKHRADVWTKAIRINGFEEGKKGKIVFRVPKLSVIDISEQSNTEAKALDQLLQVYLKNYLSRTRMEQVDQSPKTSNDSQPAEAVAEEQNHQAESDALPPEPEDVPF